MMIELCLIFFLPIIAAQTNITNITTTTTSGSSNLGFFNSTVNGGSFLTVRSFLILFSNY